MSKVKNIIRLNSTLGGEQYSVLSVINNFEKTGRIFHREASLAERASLVDLLIIICMMKFYMGENVKIRDIISLTNMGVKFNRFSRNLLMGVGLQRIFWSFVTRCVI